MFGFWESRFAQLAMFILCCGCPIQLTLSFLGIIHFCGLIILPLSSSVKFWVSATTIFGLTRENSSRCNQKKPHFLRKICKPIQHHALKKAPSRKQYSATKKFFKSPRESGLQPLLPSSRNLRPKHRTPNLHPLLIERTHGSLDVTLINLIHELPHRLLGLRRCRVGSDRA